MNKYSKALDVLSKAKLDHSNDLLIANAIADMIRPQSPISKHLINLFLECISKNKTLLLNEAEKLNDKVISEQVANRADELL